MASSTTEAAASPAPPPPPLTAETEDKRPILIYAMPGSQFTFKVLAALQARNIPHFVQFVPLDPKARPHELPSGGSLVPEMKVGTGPDATVVPDSEAILQWLDQHKVAAQFYPVQPACSDLSVRASTQKLAGLVWYYNWVHDKGFRNSMQKSLRKAIPPYLSWLVPDLAIAYFVASTRARFKTTAAAAMGISEDALDDDKTVKQILIDELRFFQSQLVDEQQPFLVPGTTQPTAADFSVYAQLERLVGEGTASDVHVPPAIQIFKEKARLEFGMNRLWQWYDAMRANYTVQFKGKRPPPELLEKKKP